MSKESSTEDSPPAVIPRHLAEPTQAAATGAATPVAVPMPAAETKQVSPSAPAVSATGDELPAPVARPVGRRRASGQEAPLKDASDEPRSENAQPRAAIRADGQGRAGRVHQFEPCRSLCTPAIEQPADRRGRSEGNSRPTRLRRAGESHPARHRPGAAEYPRADALHRRRSGRIHRREQTCSNRPRSRPAVDAIHASATHASAQSLKIQLHPAELGMVTATLRFAGEQLSIELQVENHEAYRRLSSDSETIVKSLRDLGYDIERVSVLQPSIASAAAARSDRRGHAGAAGTRRRPVRLRHGRRRKRRRKRPAARNGWRKCRARRPADVPAARTDRPQAAASISSAAARGLTSPPLLCNLERDSAETSDLSASRDDSPVATAPASASPLSMHNWRDSCDPLKNGPKK